MGGWVGGCEQVLPVLLPVAKRQSSNAATGPAGAAGVLL